MLPQYLHCSLHLTWYPQHCSNTCGSRSPVSPEHLSNCLPQTQAWRNCENPKKRYHTCSQANGKNLFNLLAAASRSRLRFSLVCLNPSTFYASKRHPSPSQASWSSRDCSCRSMPWQHHLDQIQSRENDHLIPNDSHMSKTRSKRTWIFDSPKNVAIAVWLLLGLALRIVALLGLRLRLQWLLDRQSRRGCPNPRNVSENQICHDEAWKLKDSEVCPYSLSTWWQTIFFSGWHIPTSTAKALPSCFRKIILRASISWKSEKVTLTRVKLLLPKRGPPDGKGREKNFYFDIKKKTWGA